MDDVTACYRCNKVILMGMWASVIITKDTRHRQYDLCDDCLRVVIKTLDNVNDKRRRNKKYEEA